MSLDTLLFRPCTVIRRSDSGESDDYGDAINTEAYVETKCELQQVQTDELPDVGELASSYWNLYLPVDIDIDTGDAVVVNDEEFEVVGEPWRADSGSPAMHHLEVRVRRTAGGEAGS